MRTIGLDVSSQARGTASCQIQWREARAWIEALDQGLDDPRLEATLRSEADKIGVDVPLGWPDPFVEAIVRHRDGGGFGETPLPDLVRRRTDQWVWKNVHQLPLSVSTDRISYPAMRMARILGRLPGLEQDRGGGGKVVEVYPAAALRVWRLPHRRYKQARGRDVLASSLRELRRRCPWLEADEPVWDRVALDDHSFDALISALVARAHAMDRCHPIPRPSLQFAMREGWIAVPREGTLEALA